MYMLTLNPFRELPSLSLNWKALTLKESVFKRKEIPSAEFTNNLCFNKYDFMREQWCKDTFPFCHVFHLLSARVFILRNGKYSDRMWCMKWNRNVNHLFPFDLTVFDSQWTILEGRLNPLILHDEILSVFSLVTAARTHKTIRKWFGVRKGYVLSRRNYSQLFINFKYPPILPFISIALFVKILSLKPYYSFWSLILVLKVFMSLARLNFLIIWLSSMMNENDAE